MEWRTTTVSDKYEVSDSGKVRRKDNKRDLPESFYKYPRAWICGGYYFVHRLVLEAFIGYRPEGMEARHLDGSRRNNSLANLRWGTHKENQADRVLHGTKSQGSNHGRAKLTEAKVLEIRRLGETGTPQKSIAEQFSICQTTVGRIISRKLWRHI